MYEPPKFNGGAGSSIDADAHVLLSGSIIATSVRATVPASGKVLLGKYSRIAKMAGHMLVLWFDIDAALTWYDHGVARHNTEDLKRFVDFRVHLALAHDVVDELSHQDETKVPNRNCLRDESCTGKPD